MAPRAIINTCATGHGGGVNGFTTFFCVVCRSFYNFSCPGEVSITPRDSLITIPHPVHSPNLKPISWSIVYQVNQGGELPINRSDRVEQRVADSVAQPVFHWLAVVTDRLM